MPTCPPDCEAINNRDIPVSQAHAVIAKLHPCDAALFTNLQTQSDTVECVVEDRTAITVNSCVGETADLDIIGSVDAEIVDQVGADNLCANAPWVVQPENAAVPFPINETFRGNVLTQPLTIFGDALLTGDGIIDPVGDGWLRLTDNTTTQFGGAILDTPYASNNDITFQFTYADYGGTGADGFSIFLLDGTQPMPVSLGGVGGALGYSWNDPDSDDGIADGYLGIGIDEFGNFANTNIVGAGGVGQVADAITIRGSGDAGVPLSNTYPYITHEVLPPGQTVDNHDRNNPVIIRGSIITEGANILLSVQADFGDGFVTIISREDIAITVGPMPALLRIGFAGSTGADTNFHEIRDLTISTSARQHWRGFDLDTTGGIEQCVLDGDGTLEVTASVDITIDSDTQAGINGDGDAEYYVRIVDIVTGDTLANEPLNSSPAQVGSTITLTAIANIDPNVNNLANIRVYVGAESYDLSGSYGSTWNRLQISVVNVCPGEAIETLAVSIPCGVSVTGDVNTPLPTLNVADEIDFEVVCGIVDGLTQNLFRRERREPDGTITVDFIGLDGVIVTPTTWIAGECTPLNVSTAYIERCDPFDISLPINQEATFSPDSAPTNTITVEVNTANLIADQIRDAQVREQAEVVNGLPVTPVIIETTGVTYEFPPSAFIGISGNTLTFDQTLITTWSNPGETVDILSMRYGVFSNCTCDTVELVQEINNEGLGRIVQILDPSNANAQGIKQVIPYPLEFGVTGPFSGPCPAPTQILELNSLCCDNDLLTNNPDVANQRLVWINSSILGDLFNNGVVIPGNDGDDVDEIRDRIAPGVSPSVLTEVGRDDPVYRPATNNDLSTVEFDGVDDRMFLDVGARPINQTFTLFYLVSTQDVVNGTACLLAVGPTGGGQYAGTPNTWQLSRQGFEDVLVFRGVGATTTGVGNQNPMYTPITENVNCPLCQTTQAGIDIGLATWTEFADGQLHLVTLTYDGNIMTGYFDGDLRFEADMLNDGSFPLTEYFRFSGNRIDDSFLNMNLAEVFLSNGQLTPDEIARVNSYIICEWGIDPSLAAGGAGVLELAPDGTYDSPTPFVQRVKADGTVTYLNRNNGLEFPVPPVPGLSICCLDVCEKPTELRTDIFLVDDSVTFFQVGIEETLVGWTIRHRNGTITVELNGNTFDLDAGEVISSIIEDDNLLTDDLRISATAGSTARLTTVRRRVS